jgi:hypothetical protein
LSDAKPELEQFAVDASSRMFDLNGEASTVRTKQISATIAPT